MKNHALLLIAILVLALLGVFATFHNYRKTHPHMAPTSIVKTSPLPVSPIATPSPAKAASVTPSPVTIEPEKINPTNPLKNSASPYVVPAQ